MVTLSQLNRILERLPRHKEESVEAMLEYFMEKIIIRHFQTGNGAAYNYPSLDPKYLARKQKMWGHQPMLVASGVLRESVTTMYKIYKIRGKFRIILNIPEYGRYVKEIRDFTLINKRDMRDLLRYWRTNLQKRRKVFVSQVTSRKF